MEGSERAAHLRLGSKMLNEFEEILTQDNLEGRDLTILLDGRDLTQLVVNYLIDEELIELGE